MKRIAFIVACYAVPALVLSHLRREDLGFMLGYGAATLIATAVTVWHERRREP